MKRIYIHGLGQTAHSWDKVIEASDNRDGIACPDLPGLIGDKETTYENLYAAFSKMCDAKDEELILCGLSLGGVLALNYAVEHAEKVKALVLIATPYKMPKAALMLQNIVFRFMPDSGFKGIGFTKRDFIKLCKSMMELDFTDELHKITCPALVVCGENDTANMKASVKWQIFCRMPICRRSKVQLMRSTLRHLRHCRRYWKIFIRQNCRIQRYIKV